MKPDIEPKHLTLTGLRHRCTNESNLFFAGKSHDPRYCFELFRRAILHRNEMAWDLIYQQYQPLVNSWIGRHSLFSETQENADYFVNRSFEKMWQVLTPEKFGQFNDLKSLLRYLQMCVHSSIVDTVRTKERTRLFEGDEAERWEDDRGNSLEEEVALAGQREALWEAVGGRLNDEKEVCVVYGTYMMALKPRELYAYYDTQFSNVKEVYRIRENVMARLSRDQGLKDFLIHAGIS
jgi:DNA-directed RNA polymerase specialized sigma24 family protein